MVGIRILPKAIYHYKQGQYDQQISVAQQALNVIRKAENKDLEPKILYYIGYGYYLQGDYQFALTAYLDGREVAKGLGQRLDYLDIAMAEVYLSNESYNRALIHLDSVLQSSISLGNEYKEVETLWYMANAHLGLGNYKLAQRLADSSLVRNNNRYKKNYGYANLMACRSAVQLKQLDAALDYAQEALRMTLTEHEPNKVLLATTYKQLGDVYMNRRNYNKAISHLNKGLEITTQAGYKELTQDIRLLYAQIKEKQGDMAAALAQYKLYTSLKSELFNDKKSRQLANMKIKYDSDKKDLENAGLKKTNQLITTRNTLYVIGGITLSLLLFGLSIFAVRLRQTKTKLAIQNVKISEQNLELENMDRIKTNFFSNITHEFRTPITLILEPVRQLLKRNIDEDIRKNLRLIKSNSENLLGLVNQLLDVAKIEGGKMPIEYYHGNAVNIIYEICQSFVPLANKKNITLSIKTNDDPGTFYFDLPKLKKVIINLISNAIKFTEEGGVSIVISNITPKSKDILSVEVQDTGRGIPKESLSLIFDRFYQVDGSRTRSAEGTGIGLSLTKELMELMDGNIRVHSQVNKGSTFTIHLPILHDLKEDANVNFDSSEDATHSILNGKKEYISPTINKVKSATAFSSNAKDKSPIVLLVEDNQELRTFLRNTLESKYRVLEATNGKEGINQAQQHIPDLIVSDLMMPEMDGITMTGILKKDELTSHIPIIILTAKTSIHNKIEGWQSGADSYLTKPFHSEELEIRIQKLIEIRILFHKKYSAGTEISKLCNDSHLKEIDQEFIQKLAALVKKEISNTELSVELLAQKLFLSRSQLFRKTKALIGASPNEFIRNYRLDTAKHILNSSQSSIHEVSRAVGFKNEKYFSTRFKERFNLSPSQLKVERYLP